MIQFLKYWYAIVDNKVYYIIVDENTQFLIDNFEETKLNLQNCI